ncbi:hypothetical protein EVAR_32903_1 [Eumeta japonica]|uniref:Uncharacterized protein n=1 Tax=Eumeta variegata TaxID=151549 RepID=A0A4C1VQY8_EUMVA|nr:hypothetical protein EVAR_32903_1 [Eumeta japonica]
MTMDPRAGRTGNGRPPKAVAARQICLTFVIEQSFCLCSGRCAVDFGLSSRYTRISDELQIRFISSEGSRRAMPARNNQRPTTTAVVMVRPRSDVPRAYGAKALPLTQCGRERQSDYPKGTRIPPYSSAKPPPNTATDIIVSALQELDFPAWYVRPIPL